MMSRTHITVGITAALLISNPGPENACLALMGGALGGVMPDIDLLKKDNTGDVKLGQFISYTLILGCFVIDNIFRMNIFNEILRNIMGLIIGLIFLIIMYIIGALQQHRKFTHSIFAMIIFSIPIFVIYKPLVITFMAGYISHLFIDVLNKSGEQLFFPLKNLICLRLCGADGKVSKVLMWVGLVLTIILFVDAII